MQSFVVQLLTAFWVVTECANFINLGFSSMHTTSQRLSSFNIIPVAAVAAAVVARDWLVRGVQGAMRGFDMGALHLGPSNGQPTEACLTLVASSRAGSQVFDNLSNIRFTLDVPKGPANTRQAQPLAVQQVKKGTLPTKATILGAPHQPQKAHSSDGSSSGDSSNGDSSSGASRPEGRAAAEPEAPGSLYAYDWITFDSGLEAEEEELMHPFLGATPAMKRVQRDAYKAAAARKAKEGHRVREAAVRLQSRGSNSSSGAHAESGWEALRQEYLWPDGQGVLESMFTPYESEGIYTCWSCQPDV
jgi:hypothetical protein